MPNSLDAQFVLHALAQEKRGLSIIELQELLGVQGEARTRLRKIIDELEAAGEIRRLKGTRITAATRGSGFLVGRYEKTRRGFGFVRVQPPPGDRAILVKGDIYIAEEYSGAALDGDLVRAELLRMDERGPYGRIVAVLEHTHETIVGWFQHTAKGGEVHPRNLRLDRRIVTPKPPEELGIRDFEWVAVKVTDFAERPAPLRGNVVERLGHDDDRGIDVLLLLRDRGIVEEFPGIATREAEALKVDWPTEFQRRRDLRTLPTITIDPKTAKDFDDALSIEPIERGWRLYVHIADVAHFVLPGSALDREAIDRSTSVYPVDRVVPMLPEVLSNHLCSLRPNEDHLTVTAEIDYNESGEVLRARFYDSVIRSNHRLAYEEVQSLFDHADPNLRGRLSDVLPLIESVRTLARRLREQRLRRGALDLDIPELQVIFDAQGRVADLRFAPRFEAHQLIEECMIAANEAVARELEARGAPALYRVHETANEEKLESLEPVLRAFGIRLPLARGAMTPRALQKALQQAETMRSGHIVRRLILRALQRARYAEMNLRHFGLASDAYCHFTSPIRRYPDVVVHRQIKALAAGEPLPYPREDALAAMKELASHTSAQERRAEEAEDEARHIKALEFMKRHEGDELGGVISGVQPFGMFVELEPWPVEGLIHVRDIGGDRYDIDELGIALVGRRTGRQYRLGATVQVQVLRVDPLNQELELKLLVEGEPSPKYRQRRRR